MEIENVKNEEQTKEETNWLENEAKEIEETKYDGEQLPPLILEEGKITAFEVDFTKPFDRWVDTENDNTVKKIIPVVHEGAKKNFWLSTRNPLYAQIIAAGQKGETKFKVMRTGQKRQTRYSLVKE